MARKKGSRKRDPNFVVLKVSHQMGLGTLADDTAVAGSLLDLADDVYLISADLTWSINGLTAGEGPTEVGISSNAMSVTNIIEAIDASPTSRGDRIALERTSRPVRQAGSLPGLTTNEVLNDGRSVRTSLKFALDQAQILQVYAVNRSGGSRTTGGVLITTGKVYARWT